ncbi:hypothetical protein, partial [Romboutsia sp.]|uniref:hypothetical protein n=1 Tax=Romboutsia sp. TaxID=1965302 RepID=UPI003F32C8A7
MLLEDLINPSRQIQPEVEVIPQITVSFTREPNKKNGIFFNNGIKFTEKRQLYVYKVVNNVFLFITGNLNEEVAGVEVPKNGNYYNKNLVTRIMTEYKGLYNTSSLREAETATFTAYQNEELSKAIVGNVAPYGRPVSTDIEHFYYIEVSNTVKSSEMLLAYVNGNSRMGNQTVTLPIPN